MTHPDFTAFPTELFQVVPSGTFPTHSLLAPFDNNLGNAIGSTFLESLVLNPSIQGSDADEELVGFGSDTLSILGAGGNDTVAGDLGHDLLLGGLGNDIVRGDRNFRPPGGKIGGDDLMFGGEGDDRLGGKGGNDWLVGGSGHDAMWGDDGFDVLYGGPGNDTLTGDDFSGGTGDDIFVLSLGEGTDRITDFGNGNDRILLLDCLTFEQLTLQRVGRNTRIRVGNETLAVVRGRRNLSEADFITVQTHGVAVTELMLVNDTGISSSDRLTSDPTITGQVSDSGAVQQLLAGFGSTPTVDITDALQPDGSFTLTTAQLATINGGHIT